MTVLVAKNDLHFGALIHRAAFAGDRGCHGTLLHRRAAGGTPNFKLTHYRHFGSLCLICKIAYDHRR